MIGWFAQNWLWLILFMALVVFGWGVWPRMHPNPRRVLAGGVGLVYLTVVLARLLAGAAFPLEILARSILMGLGGVLLLLSAYKARLQGGWMELSGWGILGAAALVAVLFRGAPWLVQGLVFLVAALCAIALQWINESPVSEWENPDKDRWRP